MAPSGLLFAENDLSLLDLSAVIANLEFLHGEGDILVYYIPYITLCAPDLGVMVLSSLHATDPSLQLYLCAYYSETGGTISVEPLWLMPRFCILYSQLALGSLLHCIERAVLQ